MGITRIIQRGAAPCRGQRGDTLAEAHIGRVPCDWKQVSPLFQSLRLAFTGQARRGREISETCGDCGTTGLTGGALVKNASQRYALAPVDNLSAWRNVKTHDTKRRSYVGINEKRIHAGSNPAALIQ